MAEVGAVMFVLVCLCGVIGSALYLLRFRKRERDLSTVTWAELIGRFQSTDIAGLVEIADCFLHPNAHQLRIEPGTMWTTVGGLNGLAILSSNAEVMLLLAMYAERWDDVNGRVISEIMRRDALKLRTARRHIEMSMLTQRGMVHLGMELQEAVASYCLMRARLLGMYGACHSGLLPQLAAVV